MMLFHVTKHQSYGLFDRAREPVSRIPCYMNGMLKPFLSRCLDTYSLNIQQQIEGQEGAMTKIRQDEIERNLEMFRRISSNDNLRYDLLDSAVDDALECLARHGREPNHPNYFKVALMEWFQW